VNRLGLGFSICSLFGRPGSDRLLVDLLLAGSLKFLSATDLCRFLIADLLFFCFLVCPSLGRNNGRSMLSIQPVLKPKQFVSSCIMKLNQRCILGGKSGSLEGCCRYGGSLYAVRFRGNFGAYLVLMQGHEDASGMMGLSSLVFCLKNFRIVILLFRLKLLARHLVLFAVISCLFVGLSGFFRRLAIRCLPSGQLFVESSLGRGIIGLGISVSFKGRGICREVPA